MDITGALNLMMDVERQSRSRYHLTLGGLINFLQIKLAQGNGETPVVFSDNFMLFPTSVGSYRGYYSDLAIETDGIAECGCDVEGLLDILLDTLDQELTGYKGGEFTMGEDTPLWRANYGQAPSDAIVDVTMHGGNKIVLTIKNVDG